MSTYNRLQSDSHFRRRKNLEELHKTYVKFVLNDCSPNLIQVYRDYNDWIEQRSKLITKFQAIQQSYAKQCEDIVNYVDMIDDLRTVVYKNIRKLSETSSSPASGGNGGGGGGAASNEYLTVPQPASLGVQSHTVQHAENSSSHQRHVSSGDEESDNVENNPTLMKSIRGTTKKTLQQAEEGFIKLDNIIRQIRTSLHKK